MDTKGYSPGGKQPGSGADNLSNAEVKKA